MSHYRIGLASASIISLFLFHPQNVHAGLTAQGKPIPLKYLKKHCIKFSMSQDASNVCHVMDFGELGQVDGKSYYYASYCFQPPLTKCDPDYVLQRAIFVQGESTNTARLLLKHEAGDDSLEYYAGHPEIRQNAAGTFLYLPTYCQGTSHANSSEYYSWVNGAWTLLDSSPLDSPSVMDWIPYISSGMHLDFGIRPDLHYMVAEKDLYREDDGRLGPGGGVAHIRFTVRAGRFEVCSVYVSTGITGCCGSGNVTFNEEELRAANAVLTANPRDASAYYARGIIYSDRGDYDKAIQGFDKAAESNPGYADAYNNRGLIYAVRGEYDRAIQDYEKALGLTPNDPRLYNNRGCAYDDKGDHDRAIQDYTQALKINPRFAAAYHNRGIAYKKRGDPDMSRKDQAQAEATTAQPAQASDYFGYIIKGD